jgi:predicted nucleic acid-binding protein
VNRRRYLDTNRLCAHWRRSRKRPLAEYTTEDAAEWARRLIELDGTSLILTPVLIEFLCGTLGTHHLKLSQAFLAEFTVEDEGKILARDWELAKQYACWVSDDAEPRDFGDCLLAAIAKRLKLDPLTSDQQHRRRSRRNLGNDR